MYIYENEYFYINKRHKIIILNMAYKTKPLGTDYFVLSVRWEKLRGNNIISILNNSIPQSSVYLTSYSEGANWNTLQLAF